MPEKHADEPDADVAKLLVLEACERLVGQGLAVWCQGAADELELQLRSGEVFALRESGITRVV